MFLRKISCYHHIYRLAKNTLEKITNIKLTDVSREKTTISWLSACSGALLILCLLSACSKHPTIVTKPSEIDLNISAEEQKNQLKPKTERNTWTQVQGPESAEVSELFVSSKGTLFAVSPTGIYRILEDKSGWELINNSIPLEGYNTMPMAEWNGKLYLVDRREVFSSSDNGANWSIFSYFPDLDGFIVEFVVNKEGFFLAHEDGVMRSIGFGQPWLPLNNGLEDQEITSMSTIGKTLFVGTENGLYRLQSETWQKLNEDNIKSVVSMKVSNKTLYISTAVDKSERLKMLRSNMGLNRLSDFGGKVFRSDNLGNSWVEITPKPTDTISVSDEFSLVVSGKTVILFGFNTFRSRDGGKSWTNLGFVKDAHAYSDSLVVAINDNIMYKQGRYKIIRSIDAGESWQKFMRGIVGSEIRDLVSYNNKLYAQIPHEIVYSTDGGKTWSPVLIDSGKGSVHYPSELTIVDDKFYAFARNSFDKICICQLSSDGTELLPIQGLPEIGGESFIKKLGIEPIDRNALFDSIEEEGITEKNEKQMEALMTLEGRPSIRTLAVSKDTFYVESNQHLFKATIGDSEWTDTEFDFGKVSDHARLTIEVSDKDIYVGRDDGHLFHSVDGGKKWKDLTSDLPINLIGFNDIEIVGSKIYVATYGGVLTSDTGEEWHMMKEDARRSSDIDLFFVDDNKLFGAGRKSIYLLDQHNDWKSITPTIPDSVDNFFIHDNQFYINTDEKGIFKFPIEIQ